MPREPMAYKIKRLYISALDSINRFTAEINQAYTTYTGDASRFRN